MFFLNLTGIELHQWFGVAICALTLYHLIKHWNWVEAVSKRFFCSTTHRARWYFIVDASLLLGFVGILVTGLVISTWLSLSFENAPAWNNLHEIISIITLLLILVKIAIHWRWIVKTAGQINSRPMVPTIGRLAVQPAKVSYNIDRRDFLKLMGIVSTAAAVALINITAPAENVESQVNTTHLINGCCALGCKMPKLKELQIVT